MSGNAAQVWRAGGPKTDGLAEPNFRSVLQGGETEPIWNLSRQFATAGAITGTLVAPFALIGMFAVTACHWLQLLLGRFGAVGRLPGPSLLSGEGASLHERPRLNYRQEHDDYESGNCQYREDLPN